MKINIKRIYAPCSEDDGYRVLVDRLWPRGVAKAKAKVDLWYKEIAPSNELRIWFHHEGGDWSAFRERYQKELEQMPRVVEDFVKQLHGHAVVTLLYGAKDHEHNQAVVLGELLKQKHI